MRLEATDRREMIISLLRQHESWRASCINLVAAENAMSPIVASLLSSDLARRYGDYAGRDLRARRYWGTQFIVELEIEVAELAKKVFHARFVELRPLSGHVASICVIVALCKPGDLVFELGQDEGGHRVATKFAASKLIDLEVEYLPFDEKAFNVDVEGCLELVRRRRPRLIIVGGSNFLFPVPLRELSNGLRDFPETTLAYDASHVLGLIAGGAFQDPLKEGADLVLGGTQKSFPGPQGGLIYSDLEDLIDEISHSVHPSILSNHHLARLPSLGLALLEMKLWGAEYAGKVISNAQLLAQALIDQQIPVLGSDGAYTQSHTIVINTCSLGSNDELGRRLEQVGIIVTAMRIPKSMGGFGLRLGTNEITRRGATEEQMEDVARLIADAIFERRSLDSVREDVHKMSELFRGYAFTWPDQ
jgi:glycine hydroxymethyltransferase